MPEGEAASRLASKLAALLQASRPVLLARTAALRQAAEAAAGGQCTGALRLQARDEAHKLAGVLGSFGLRQGSALASRAEQMLEAGLTQQDAHELLALAEALTVAIEQAERPL